MDSPPRDRPRTGRARALLLLALALVLLGGGTAAWAQTSGGDVAIQDVRFNGADGRRLSGLLYVPDGVSAADPAPAVLAVHGYINSRETQDAFAIEYSRRGYVVLALDQQGHGFSDPPAMQNGFGGPAALAYLRSLDIVDTDNIGLEGHSMGGWTVLNAAAAFPEGYRSMVLVGSSPGDAAFPAAPPGTTEFPRNLANIYGTWEEFSPLMYGVDNPADANGSEKMRTLFGTEEEVVEGRVYGDIEEGTARVLYRPANTHPGLHFDPRAVDRATDWMARTLEGGHPAPGQIWWLKELGTLVAFAGGLLFLFPFGALLLRTPYFAGLRGSVPRARGIPRGPGWWASAAVATALPAVTFFWVQDQTNRRIEVSGLFPQLITTGFMGWAVVGGLISLALLAVWHLRANRGAGAADYGLRFREAGRAALFAASVTAGLYALLAFSDWAFTTDFRIWVAQLHLMDALHFRIFLTYLLPFAFFFVVLGTVLHGQFRPSGAERSLRREMAANAGIVVAGLAVLIVVDYVPLLAGGTLAVPTQPLLIIVAFQAVLMLAVAALLSTYFFRATGSVLPGAFVNAVLITWNLVAGTATQHPVTAWGGGSQFVRVGLPLLLGLALLGQAARRLRTRGDKDDAPAEPGEAATA
ncbi:alpha/beta fold hydrolase [Streptomyces sp. DSM 44917]|uniref:Alpha/beta fold hydrolase n=1 Tax=Streptomyces boetiae TaxID=3075541 RepID=A0ABU2L4I5_9ACTN|nr:alpha/beta fold hydrolase [Streptomyces sp. DSM 44917]MDT0306470.1 alpha/beta fold hydrolase [Streptomyces sp. DSM 44917]